MHQKLSLLVLYYFRFFARLQIKKIAILQKLKGDKLIIIGITASTGKTTTVKTVCSALTPFYKIKTNTRSSESGISLNILNIQTHSYSLFDWLRMIVLFPTRLVFCNWSPYKIYLTEMSVDSPFWPKNMSFLQTIINPDIAVFLNVNPVHSFNFDKQVPKNITGKKRLNLILQSIATEKAKLINSDKYGKLSIANIDDPAVKNSINTLNQLQTIGHAKADIQITTTKINKFGFKSNFFFKNRTYPIHIKNSIFPSSFTTSIATAILIANHLNISPTKAIQSILKHFQNEPGRSGLFTGIRNTVIIDSSYNSSPSAVFEMLDLLKNFSGRKIAVLGDMRELGLQSKISHRSLYQKAIKIADLIVGIGPQTQKYFKTTKQIHTFQFWWQAQDFLKQNIQGKETILVKGSQNTIFLEELVKSLLKNKSNSVRLCRQSKYWLNLKSKFRQQNQLPLHDPTFSI